MAKRVHYSRRSFALFCSSVYGFIQARLSPPPLSHLSPNRGTWNLENLGQFQSGGLKTHIHTFRLSPFPLSLSASPYPSLLPFPTPFTPDPHTENLVLLRKSSIIFIELRLLPVLPLCVKEENLVLLTYLCFNFLQECNDL